MTTPVDSDYPALIMEAAKTFANQCGAHAQVQLVEQEMKLCVQAPRIMQQFMGDVDFGKDPAGLLFYNNTELDFSVPDQAFRYTAYGAGPWITVQIDFFTGSDDGSGDHFLSRFIARVKSESYAYLSRQGESGRGNWSKFSAGTAQGITIRAEGRPRIYLQLPALRKYVFFETKDSSPIEEKSGIFIFKNYATLQDKVREEVVLASWSDDRITFYVKGHPETIVGLYLPDVAIGISKMELPVTTSWRTIEDE
ncbi:hypothetical protein BJ165DRAFT_1523175 [Panaeolus papilionaceus]|nr:hypothetical protein BJ165DRAFT_1523175 [Panaeolus papilionaceus]